MAHFTQSKPPTAVQGRALSRAKSRRTLDFATVLKNLEDKGISIRVASPKLITEEVYFREPSVPP